MKLQKLLHYLQCEKIINTTKFTTPVIKRLSYSTPRALPKVFGKIISKKLVLTDATQLKARYMYTESQLAWESRVNLKIHEYAIRES